MTDLRWYWASSPKATIGIEVSDGKVVATAPYARKWLLGKTEDEAVALLRSQGWLVRRGDQIEGLHHD